MAWLRGIRISIVPAKGQRGGMTTTCEDTWQGESLPEFPHPDSSSVHLVDTGVPLANREAPSSSTSRRSEKSCNQQKTHPRISVYVPSYPGTQFSFEWAIDRFPESSSHMYFVLLVNGHRMVSWGTDPSKPNASRGVVDFALYEPSDRWNYSDHGVKLKREGVEKRYFYFSAAFPGSSVATDGGLFEIQVFRSMGKQRRAPNPGEYRDQAKYGITCLSGGLVETPQDLTYYSWILIDPRDSPFATFRFYYRSYNSLGDLNLIPSSQRHASADIASHDGEDETTNEIKFTCSDNKPFHFGNQLNQDAALLEDYVTIEEGLWQSQESRRGSLEKAWIESDSLKSLPEVLLVHADQQIPQPSKEFRDVLSHSYLQQSLPVLPPSESHSRKSSVASRAISIASSLLPFVDEYSEVDDIEIGVATRFPLASLSANMKPSVNSDACPLPQSPSMSSLSDYNTSPPASEVSQLSPRLSKQIYQASNVSALDRGTVVMSSSLQRETQEQVSSLAVSAEPIPEGAWLKRSPSPLRRRKGRAHLSPTHADAADADAAVE